MSLSEELNEPRQDMEPSASDDDTAQAVITFTEGAASQEHRRSSIEHREAMDLLFQDVVFYLNPFFGREKAAELETVLKANGALKVQLPFPKSDRILEQVDVGNLSVPTHIITDDLDFPDYKHASARGIHIVLLPTFDRELIRDAVEDYGGIYTSDITTDVTHLIALAPSGDKYNYVMKHPDLGIKTVLPHWFQLCCNLKRLLPETIYQFPNPPMLDSKYSPNRTELPQGYAPLLFSNSNKSVVAFLTEPSEHGTRFLQGFRILLGDDLSIVPDLRVRIEEKIEQAGGILAAEYSSLQVDIVICRFRAGFLYTKASKDGKIVASNDWLLHVLQTGELPSPKASLLHYPIPPEPIPGMSSLVMTISNYHGPVREYLKRMIVAAGAKYKPTLSGKNAEEPTTHIICGNASGEKYVSGNMWNVKVVNHIWLEDCYQVWSMQSETKPRYTLFPANNQLSLVFGAKILPDTLEDWIPWDEDEDEDENEDGRMSHLQPLEGSNTTSSLSYEMPSRASNSTLELQPSEDRELGQRDGHQGQEKLDHNIVKTGARVEVESELSSFRPSTPPLKAFSALDREPQSDSATSSPNALPSPSNFSAVDGQGVSSIRVVSRKRGAALQASKALQKIVPDMNEFQEELRDEKKASKKKKKHLISEDSKTDDAESIDLEEMDIPLALPHKKQTATQVKRRRISMGSVGDRSTPARSDEDNDGEEQENVADTITSWTQSKKVRRGAKSDKEKEKERRDVSMEVDTAADQGAGLGAAAGAGKLKRVRFVSTGVKEQGAAQLRVLKSLGIMPATTVEKCTHLVATSIARTGKFLIALLQGKIIVREDWLQACINANAIVDEDSYRIEDHANEQKLGMHLYESLERAREKRVFENCVFYLSPSMMHDMPGLKSVIEAGGGRSSTLLQTGLGFLKDRLVKAKKNKSGTGAGSSKGKTSGRRKGAVGSSDGNSSEDDSDSEEIVAVVSNDKDKEMWQPILDAGAHVYSHDLISISVLTQRLDLGETHALA
ncbi:hypothetical protein BGZ98_003633 [Dissophora globulifera]|nr:hypothetical protein BGZ98_003633 [Dissophora globulifera]